MNKAGFIRRVSATIKRYPWVATGSYRLSRLYYARYSVGAVGVIFNSSGQVLLVEHAFHPRTPWGLPGGWVDRGEDPAQTVQREIAEELSLTVHVGPLIAAEVSFPGHLDIAYLVEARGEIGTLSYELIGYQWYDVENLPLLLSFHQRVIRLAPAYQYLIESQNNG